MSQQINLFNPALGQKKKHFSTVTMLQALLLIGAGGLCLVAFLDYRGGTLEKLAEIGKEQLTAREAKLVKVNAQFAPRRNSPELASQVVAAQAALTTLQGAKDELQRADFGNARGHSLYFSALARQTVSGLWLTGLSISGSGRDISIEGRALRAELVPQLIRRLASEPAFHGKSFASLDISQAPSADADADSGKPGGSARSSELAFRLQAAGASLAPGSASR
jgi:hypothetical protein